ncbi:MAG: hemerythrin domain-containing protein [Eubacteriales bacterium]|nr:hemerythrin domain-containing protein [Eubacteriales bacterium]
MDVIDSMMQEHDVIYRFVAVIRTACCHILEGEPLCTEDFHNMTRFAREYADRYHHGKEEKILFREMTKRLGPAAEKVIRNGMLVEHDLGRLHINELEQALQNYEQTPSTENKLAVITHACGWAALLQRHMDKENAVVYMFARRELPADVLESISEETKAFDASQEHKKEAQSSLSLLEELASKYNI